MPCLSYDSSSEHAYEESQKQRRTIERLEASLCAVLTVLEAKGTLNTVLKDIDCKEAGITVKQIRSWFKAHRLKDYERRLREAKANDEQKKLNALVNKYKDTPKEDLELMRKALDKLK